MWTQLFLYLQSQFPFLLGMMKTNSYPHPLSANEEQRCIQAMQQNDKQARNELIDHNLRLVAHIVKKYDIQKESTDDLISVGTIGLIKGIDTFDPSKGRKLTTYISRCIENEILMYLRSMKRKYQTVSLDENIGVEKDDSEITLLDILKDESQKTPIDAITLKDNINKLDQYYQQLDDREKEILDMRYGLHGKQEMTQREIAQKENISRSYVSRIEKKAFLKLLRSFIKHEQ
ncbi:MAG: RNA polymerase sporulation sigma factor SigK [Erysipelotrichaceae bacterium]|nr:RNA polymerase sporulation sigma factor SigK [Erysipelotrichaceae bacterium]